MSGCGTDFLTMGSILYWCCLVLAWPVAIQAIAQGCARALCLFFDLLAFAPTAERCLIAGAGRTLSHRSAAGRSSCQRMAPVCPGHC